MTAYHESSEHKPCCATKDDRGLDLGSIADMALWDVAPVKFAYWQVEQPQEQVVIDIV